MLRCWLPLAILLAPACARELPAPPGVGEACDSDADCNPEDDAARGCGFQRLCVSNRCELDTDAGGSRLVVCEGAEPVDLEADDGGA